MKRSHILAISVVCIIMMVVGFTYGYSFLSERFNGNAKPNTPNNQGQNNIDEGDGLTDNLVMVEGNDQYISPNTTIEYVIYYLQCGHKVEKTGKASNDIINLNEEGLQSFINRSHPNWRVTLFSSERVVIEIDKDQLCSNHYIIGVKDGKIAIFEVNEDGERVLDKVLENAPISMLKLVDQEKLKQGIIVNSKEEISDILENFIS